MRPLNFFPTPDPAHASVPRSSANFWGGCMILVIVAACIGSCTPSTSSGPAPGVHDPGVRGGPAGAGGALPGLTADETTFFQDGLTRFLEMDRRPV